MIKQNIPLQNTEWVTEIISTRQSWEAKPLSRHCGFPGSLWCDQPIPGSTASLQRGTRIWTLGVQLQQWFQRKEYTDVSQEGFPSWWWELKGREKVIFRPVSPTAQPLWTVRLTEHISRNSCHVSLTDSHCRWAPGTQDLFWGGHKQWKLAGATVRKSQSPLKIWENKPLNPSSFSSHYDSHCLYFFFSIPTVSSLCSLLR